MQVDDKPPIMFMSQSRSIIMSQYIILDLIFQTERSSAAQQKCDINEPNFVP
jgi:hypothetical protein